MHIIRDQKTKKTYRLMLCYLIIGWLVVAGMTAYIYLTSGNKRILILPALLFVNNILGLLYFRRLFKKEYSADVTGIKVLLGQRTLKSYPWHSFVYVGELNVPGRDAKTPTQRMIACLPQPPKPALGKEDCYTISQKGAICIDYTPEDAQIMRGYYRGTL